MTEVSDVQIVLVEDSPDDAELTMRSMRQINIVNDIVWLKDGEEAINYLLGEGESHARPQKKPSLILLDLKLPKINGTEVLARLKNDEQMKQVPVVVMTSSGENKDIEKCYELGANSYVIKPIGFKKFMDLTSKLSMYWILINKAPNQKE